MCDFKKHYAECKSTRCAAVHYRQTQSSVLTELSAYVTALLTGLKVQALHHAAFCGIIYHSVDLPVFQRVLVGLKRAKPTLWEIFSVLQALQNGVTETIGGEKYYECLELSLSSKQ